MLAVTTTWAADNDCFNGFKQDAYVEMLGTWQGVRPPPLFVTAPDVVADAKQTAAYFDEWEPALHRLGYPVALVAQDGIEQKSIPWPRLESLFIGGSTQFKLSEASRQLCAEAKRRGKWVHVGRVNSFKRMETAARFGADSVDGSGFSKWKKLIGPGIRWLKRAKWLAKHQPLLFE